MTVVSSLSVTLSAMETGSGDLGVPSARHLLEYSLELASGTTANKADLVFSDSRTLTATSESLDVLGGLTGLLGTATNFVEIVLVAIRNKATSGILTVGNAASPVYTGLFGAGTSVLVIPPGGLFLWSAPADGPNCLVPVAASADLLKIDSGASTIPYDIFILGRSA